MLEEHQSVLELIMNKYRQQVKKINETTKAEKVWAQKDFSLVIKILFLKFTLVIFLHSSFKLLHCLYVINNLVSSFYYVSSELYF